MSKALTKSSAKPAAPFGSLQGIDPKELEKTIEQMYFQGKNVTPEQKAVFAHAVNRTGLDPIVGQIRPIIRDTKKGPTRAVQTSIDGYRVIAARTGEHAGTDDAVYPEEATEEGEETQWYTDEHNARRSRSVKTRLKHPVVASVTAYRLLKGVRCPFTASARWKEYYPGNGNDGFMWRKMPYLMLAKCAEALALRKAFPADLSGIYTDDEMHQAGQKEEDRQETPPRPTAPPKAELVEPPKPPASSVAQQEKILSLAKDLKMDVQKDICTPMKAVWPLTAPQAEAVIKRLEQKLSKELDSKTVADAKEVFPETDASPKP